MTEPRAPRPGAETLAEPLRSRWSPRVFDAAHRLTREQVETLLRAAQWAPSFGNTQPWAFVVAERGTPAHDVLVAHLSRGNAGWVPRASLVLVSATRTGPGEDGKPPSRYAEYDLGQAAAHLTLQARAMGLHARQFAGFDHEAVAAALGVPGDHRVMSGIAVGVPGDPSEGAERDVARDRRDRVRRDLGRFAFAGRWGSPWPGDPSGA